MTNRRADWRERVLGSCGQCGLIGDWTDPAYAANPGMYHIGLCASAGVDTAAFKSAEWLCKRHWQLAQMKAGSGSWWRPALRSENPR
jgi:hypothetical protein